jgi:hypothetical protein
LLAQAPPAGFVADLFSGIHNRATITITTPGMSREGTYGSGTGSCCAGGDINNDWPEFGIYQLSETQGEGSFVLLTSPDPVYAIRLETRHQPTDGCGNFTFLVLGPEERRSFIAHMLGMQPDDMEWKTESRDTIAFTSEPHFYRELRRFIVAEQEKYRVTGAALVAKNLMTVSEQEESLPFIDLAFKDQRGPNAVPISEPSSLPQHVSWPKHP